MKITGNLKKDVTKLKQQLKSEDIVFLSVTAGKTPAVIIFVKDLVDKANIGDLILRPLSKVKGKIDEDNVTDYFLSPERKKVSEYRQITEEVVMAKAVFLCDGLKTAYSFAFEKFEKRSITEPPTSTVIKGPREGFVESLPVNISLIRRKIKSPDLRFENLIIGEYSKTPVCLCYVHGIADEKLVEKLKGKLSHIDIDAVLDSSYVTKFLGEHKTSVFKQVGNTEKPDILAAKILEGRVAVLVDGSPIALTVPYLLIEDFQSPSDYYNSAYTATMARTIRLFSVLLSVFLPAFFVAAELFHLQLIPLSFLLTIVNSIKGIPLSPSFEMFFTLLIFEILNEASVRMPRYVGMVVSIVGGLVLGETAVSAGIISAPTLMIVALSGICLYTVPELEQIFSLIRVIFLVIGGSVGGYGLILASAGLLIYLVSFENYSTPLVAPFSPLITKDLKDGFYKGFLIEQKYRPLSISNDNKRRMKKREEKINK